MDDFDVILFTLGDELQKAYARTVGSFLSDLDDYVDAEDYDGAMDFIDSYDLYPVYEDNADLILHYNYLAFIWGVHKISPATSARSTVSGKPLDIVKTAAEQVGFLLQGSTITMRNTLKGVVHDLVSAIDVEERGTSQKAEQTPKQRILMQYKNKLRETAKTGGGGLIDLVASLNTSRMASYGFMNEATLVGITHYRYNALMDVRTSDVCSHLNNQIFPVSPAYTRLDAELRINDSTTMKEFAPWVAGNKNALEEFRNLSRDELMEKGWAYPPMHPRCRSTVEYVEGKIQVAGLEIPTAPTGLKEILSEQEIQAILRTVGLTSSTINLGKGMLLSGMSAIEVMTDLAISAEAMALIQAALDFDLL
ncbi:ParB-like nuclease domain protein [Vibrio phage vB_VpS_PG28]|nr:ParB-like nuclease domain protein [Vibrio phage vB_VpS_PG28]